MLVPSILYLKIIKDILRRNNMKEWTREERYRTILEASNEEITELKKNMVLSVVCKPISMIISYKSNSLIVNA